MAALERNLVSQAIRLDPDEIRDLTTRTAMLQSVASLGLPRPSGTAPPDAPAARAVADSWLDRIARLRAPAEHDVRAALAAGPVTPDLAGHLIRLLARDDVLPEATRALRPLASAGHRPGWITACSTPTRIADPAARSRARWRTYGPTGRTALLRGLAARAVRVRYRCGRALHLHESDSGYFRRAV
jgi:hypothetical protein